MKYDNPLDKTHPEVERRMIDGIRRKFPAGKIQHIVALNEMLDAIALAVLREQYPVADEAEYRMRLASRRLPPELMKKAYGWEVELKGY